jgi:hypothetical protein
MGSAANWPTGIDTDPPTDAGRLKYVLLQIGATLGVAALAPPAAVSTAAVATTARPVAPAIHRGRAPLENLAMTTPALSENTDTTQRGPAGSPHPDRNPKDFLWKMIRVAAATGAQAKRRGPGSAPAPLGRQ